jgi:hypothetical protein
MKKILLLVLFVGLFSNEITAQKYNGNISGMIGLINTKIRLQYEKPIGNRYSAGVNMNYYLVNWKGPMIEPFFRMYNSKEGNEKGFFGQVKLSYANLSTLDYDLYSFAIANKRWSSFGLGAGVGYKFLWGKRLTFQATGGLRFVSPPLYRYNSGYDEDVAATIGEGIGWYLTTGLPIDFQLKMGYQF